MRHTDDGGQGRENGRRSPPASRSAPVCRHLCLPLRRSHRNFSKVILRHSNLSTTQRYLGKITDTEAMKWIENLYGGSGHVAQSLRAGQWASALFAGNRVYVGAEVAPAIWSLRLTGPRRCALRTNLLVLDRCAASFSSLERCGLRRSR